MEDHRTSSYDHEEFGITRRKFQRFTHEKSSHHDRVHFALSRRVRVSDTTVVR